VASKSLVVAGFAFFYAYWKVEYVPLLIFSVCFNYAVAEFITRHRHRPEAQTAFVAGVSINLLLLGYYKYTNFILGFIGRVSQRDFGRFDILPPRAISFFTFTQIAYKADSIAEFWRRWHITLTRFSRQELSAASNPFFFIANMSQCYC
jgi:alginate O-acetyltransferase complex protein AlgI